MLHDDNTDTTVIGIDGNFLYLWCIPGGNANYYDY